MVVAVLLLFDGEEKKKGLGEKERVEECGREICTLVMFSLVQTGIEAVSS